MPIGKYPDRVKETSASTGSTTFTLDGAATGFRSFAAAVADGATVDVCIAQQDGSQWQVCEVTFTSPSTATVGTVYSNSSGTTSAITFSAGTKDIYVVFPADDIERVVSIGRAVAFANRMMLP